MLLDLTGLPRQVLQSTGWAAHAQEGDEVGTGAGAGASTSPFLALA
jgi:hypothetical protein